MKTNGGEYRNRTGVHGFAIRPLSQEKQEGAVSKDTPTNRELYEKVSNADLSGEEENAAAAGPRNGAESIYEAGQLPAHDSPLWDGAPDIIARHFAGVLA